MRIIAVFSLPIHICVRISQKKLRSWTRSKEIPTFSRITDHQEAVVSHRSVKRRGVDLTPRLLRRPARKLPPTGPDPVYKQVKGLPAADAYSFFNVPLRLAISSSVG